MFIFFQILFAAALIVDIVGMEYMRQQANARRPADNKIPIYVADKYGFAMPFSTWWGVFEGYAKYFPNSRLPLLVKVCLVLPFVALAGMGILGKG